MRILNFGSLNIDHVYTVEHFVRPGETLGSTEYRQFAGGKGLNQSIALARAGAEVCHAGKIGADGTRLKERLERDGVDTTHVSLADTATGHAMIQVDRSGENAIVLHGGANQGITEADVVRVLAGFSPGDYLLLQNEISSVPGAITEGARRGLRIVLNPAPMTDGVAAYPLDLVDIFILNETEAEGLTGATDPEAVGAAMRKAYPKALTVLTLGAEGAMCFGPQGTVRRPAEKANVVDTTGAGDTFIGYFLASWMRTGDAACALDLGSRAAALCVSRPGAAESIPHLLEMDGHPGRFRT